MKELSVVEGKFWFDGCRVKFRVFCYGVSGSSGQLQVKGGLKVCVN